MIKCAFKAARAVRVNRHCFISGEGLIVRYATNGKTIVLVGCTKFADQRIEYAGSCLALQDRLSLPIQVELLLG